MLYTLVNFFFYVDSEECFDNLQSQLQDSEVLQQSFNDLHLTTTPSSHDSGLPLISPAFKQEGDFEYYVYPSIKNSHHISIYLNGVAAVPMPSIYNKNSRPHQSHGRSVHWEDEFVPPSREENYYNHSHAADIKQCGPQINVNTSLPYHSKVNIRVQVNRKIRDEFNDDNHIKATATVQRLDPTQDRKHFEDLQRAYYDHYLIQSPNDHMRTNTRTDVPIRYEITPRHRHISIPISLPIDHRLFLYIHNGEIYARC